MRMRGLEPPRAEAHGDLNAARLPIPPHPRVVFRIIHIVDPLVTVHLIAASALVVTTLGVGIWGLVRAGSIGAGSNEREARWFAQALQLSHSLVLATLLLGLALLAEGHRSSDPLHVRVYGPFMLVAIIAAYGYRTRDARRNVQIFAISALVIVALGARSFWTGT